MSPLRRSAGTGAQAHGTGGCRMMGRGAEHAVERRCSRPRSRREDPQNTIKASQTDNRNPHCSLRQAGHGEGGTLPPSPPLKKNWARNMMNDERAGVLGKQRSNIGRSGRQGQPL